MRSLLMALLFSLAASHASAQSLFILQGERAVEGSAGWSVGPFSHGLELQGGVSLDGRWDVGFALNRYTADLGGADDTVVTEWSPSVRFFFFKEQDDSTLVSLAANAQFAQTNYEADDEGWYALAGAQLYKQFALVEGFTLFPFLGFAVAAESTSFGGADAEGEVYLTRQFGVHAQVSLGTDAWLRVTAEEQSFRRETFRAARVAYVRRF